MTGKTSGRKQLYVSKAIQGRILRRLAFYWLLYHFVLWHALFVGEAIQRVDYTQTFVELYSSFCSENVQLILVAALAFPFICWDMLKLTNGVAGPFVRFERALRKMTQGEQVPTVDIRDGDLVYEFADVFNEFVEARNRELEAGNPDDQPAAESDAEDPNRVDEPALSGS